MDQTDRQTDTGAARGKNPTPESEAVHHNSPLITAHTGPVSGDIKVRIRRKRNDEIVTEL